MLANLGIYNKRHILNENIDYDLNQHIQQGVEFKNYGQKYYSENDHQLLAASSSPEWGSIAEAFDSSDSTKGVKTSVEGMASYNTTDNTNFNSLISNYATTHHTYASTMLGSTPPTDSDRLEMERSLNDQKNTIISSASQENFSTNSDAIVKAMLSSNQDKIHDYMARIKQQKYANAGKYDDTTIAGAMENTSLNMTSMYYHFLVYFLISATLIAFTFNIMVNPDANVMNAIVVVGALCTVYIISRHYAL